MQGGTEIRGHSGTIKDGEIRRRRSNLRERGHCQGEESQQRSRPMVTQVFVHYVAVSYSLDTISHQVQCPTSSSLQMQNGWRHDAVCNGKSPCRAQTLETCSDRNSSRQTYFGSQTGEICLQMLTGRSCSLLERWLRR